jgi:hypothetical protein
VLPVAEGLAGHDRSWLRADPDQEPLGGLQGDLASREVGLRVAGANRQVTERLEAAGLEAPLGGVRERDGA